MLMDRYSLLQKIGIYIGIFVFLLFVLLPFIEMFRVSLRPLDHLMATPFTLWSDDCWGVTS
jgi:multiple sugar transport system permease protein